MTCLGIGEVTRKWVGIGIHLTVRRLQVGKQAGVCTSFVRDSRRDKGILAGRTVTTAARVQMVGVMIFVTGKIVERIRPYEIWKHAELLRTLKAHVGAMLFRAFVIGLPLVLLAGCQGRKTSTSHEAVIPVRTSVASSVLWPETVSVPATVSAVEVADLASRNSGWISQINVVAGQHVSQSQLLVTVGLAAARYRLVAAKARLSVAEVNWSAASANEARYVFLVRTHATSGKRYDEVHSAFVAAKAELASARSALADARKNMDYADIRAPFSGTIVKKSVRRGTFVAPGTALLKIAGNQPEIRAHVSSAVLQRLKLGQTSEVDIDGKSQLATITNLVNAADTTTYTHLVELHLRQGVSAPFGSYAELHLILGRTRRVTIPAAAITRRAGLLGVFVIDGKNLSHFRLVRIGATHDGRVALVAGLDSGEKVVVSPPMKLMNGSTVRVQAFNSTSFSRNVRG